MQDFPQNKQTKVIFLNHHLWFNRSVWEFLSMYLFYFAIFRTFQGVSGVESPANIRTSPVKT